MVTWKILETSRQQILTNRKWKLEMSKNWQAKKLTKMQNRGALLPQIKTWRCWTTVKNATRSIFCSCRSPCWKERHQKNNQIGSKKNPDQQKTQKEGRKEGRQEARKEGREGRKQGRKGKEGKDEGRKEGRKEARKEGEGRKGRRKEGRQGGRKEEGLWFMCDV